MSFTDLGLLIRTVEHAGRHRLLPLAMLTVLGGLAEFSAMVAVVALLRRMLDEATRNLPTSLAALFAVALIAAGFLRWALLRSTQQLATTTGHRLLVQVQGKLLARDWLSHASDKATTPLMAVEQVETVIFQLLLPLLQVGTAAVLGSSILIALLTVNAGLAGATILLLTGLVAAANLLVRPTLVRAGAELEAQYEARVAALQAQTGAMRELILAGAQGLALKRLKAIDARLSLARAEIGTATATPRLIIETLGLLVLLGCAWLLAGHAGLMAAAPALVGLALGLQRLLPLAQTIAQASGNLAAYGPALRALNSLLALPDRQVVSDALALSFPGRIRLRKLDLTYPGRTAPALSDINLELVRGERLALVGRNGSGKSSLADLLMGLVQPTAGDILLDGVPLHREQVPGWRRNIAHVPQAPFLADGSIAENIAFAAGEPDHPRVVTAARMAGLHEWIEQLPRGYETRVGERGQLLSGGQRQRLALARALYRPAPLLVLDEATSALDPESERHILRALDELQAAGTTILIIAHRESMLTGCDRIIRLDDGKVAELKRPA